MSLRERVEQHKTAVAAVAVLASGTAMWLAISSSGNRSASLFRDKWMLDLNTGELVRAAVGTPSPNASESGDFGYPGMTPRGATVDAVVFTCRDPNAISAGMTADDLTAVGARVAYLQRAPDDWLQQAPDAEPATEPPQLIGTPDGGTWSRANTREANELLDSVRSFCDDGLPAQARP